MARPLHILALYRAALTMTERPTFEEIDRVARAICMAENDDPCGAVYGAIDENERNGYRHMARAAILAFGEQARKQEG